MEKVRQDWKPEYRGEIVALEAEDELVLYDPKADHVHLLNTVAAAVYELCDGTNTVEGIIRLVKEQVPSSTSGVENDLIQLFASFLEKGFLQQERDHRSL